MGGRMSTLKESKKSVETYQADQRARRSSKGGPRRKAAGFSVNDRVMDLAEHRPATVRGVLGGDIYVIRYVDDETKAQVAGSRLTSRFTTQTVGFVPKGAERAEITEESAA